jgi:uncharacterized protein YcbK (DUF882 family)
VLRSRLATAAGESRALPFYCLHTGEALTVEYCTRGRYQRDALRAVDRLLRDHRTNQAHAIDPALLDALWALRRRVGSGVRLHVVSGYRSPETNAMLQRTEPGVARGSYHVQGRALDFFLPDRQLRQVRRAAVGLQFGGVGYYPASGFVHVDSGPVRSW